VQGEGNCTGLSHSQRTDAVYRVEGNRLVLEADNSLVWR
jgi:hypothetical protein